MEVWKIIFLSKRVICRFHVNLPGCIWLDMLIFFQPGHCPWRFNPHGQKTPKTSRHRLSAFSEKSGVFGNISLLQGWNLPKNAISKLFQTSGHSWNNLSPSPTRFPWNFRGPISPTFHHHLGFSVSHLAFLQFLTETFHCLKCFRRISGCQILILKSASFGENWMNINVQVYMFTFGQQTQLQ